MRQIAYKAMGYLKTEQFFQLYTFLRVTYVIFLHTKMLTT